MRAVIRPQCGNVPFAKGDFEKWLSLHVNDAVARRSLQAFCVCAFAAAHPIEDRCWDKGPDHQILMYCNQVAVHPAHGPHHDHPSVPAERTIAVVSSTTSANGTLHWQGGRPAVNDNG
jgi:hypothetical protein